MTKFLLFYLCKLKEDFYTVRKHQFGCQVGQEPYQFLPRSELKTTLLRLVHRLDFVSLNDKVIVCVQQCCLLCSQELSNPRHRDRLLSAMMVLKKSVGLLSASMQTYLINTANLQAKVSREVFLQMVEIWSIKLLYNIIRYHPKLKDDIFGLNDTGIF